MPFADQLQPGDRFLLDGRCLEFCRREWNHLLVTEASGYPAAPRWTGKGWPLSTELARRLFLFRTQAAEALREGPAALARLLSEEYGLDGDAARALIDFFQRQECVSEIPDPANGLIEVIRHDRGADYYFHTPLNRAGNDALARVAVARLVRDHGRSADSLVADLGLVLGIRGDELTPETFRALLRAEGFTADLDGAIRTSWTLREHFRSAALTGLMLLRNPAGRRRRVGGRDWAERRLFARVQAGDPDFVLLRQARHEVQTQLLDAEAARGFLEELPRKSIRWRRLVQVSPLAQAWTQAAAGPVESVETVTEVLQRLHAELMAAR